MLELFAFLLQHVGRGINRLRLRLAQRRILHKERVLHVFAPVFFDRAIAIERFEQLARLLLVVHVHDDAHGQPTLVECVLQSRPDRCEFVGGDGVEDLKEQRVIGPIG